MQICDTLWMKHTCECKTAWSKHQVWTQSSVRLFITDQARFQTPSGPSGCQRPFYWLSLFINTVVQMFLLQLYRYTCNQVGDQEVSEFDLNERLQNIFQKLGQNCHLIHSDEFKDQIFTVGKHSISSRQSFAIISWWKASQNYRRPLKMKAGVIVPRSV